jgi:hypothetical protein
VYVWEARKRAGCAVLVRRYKPEHVELTWRLAKGKRPSSWVQPRSDTVSTRGGKHRFTVKTRWPGVPCLLYHDVPYIRYSTVYMVHGTGFNRLPSLISLWSPRGDTSASSFNVQHLGRKIRCQFQSSMRKHEKNTTPFVCQRIAGRCELHCSWGAPRYN